MMKKYVIMWIFIDNLESVLEGSSNQQVRTEQVTKNDIVMYLPKPITTGGTTKRVQSMLKFPINLDEYKCQ